MKPKSEMTATEQYAEVSMLLECYCESIVLNCSAEEIEKYRAEAEAFDSDLYKKVWTKTRIKLFTKEARQRVREEGW
jgi:hypothetical protein